MLLLALFSALFASLRRIEFVDIQLQGDPEPKKLIFDLMDQKQLPENWFTHTAHHSEDAEVDYQPPQ